MPDTALPLRIGTRTLLTFRRCLARRRLSLAEALAGTVPALTSLGEQEDGYLVNALPQHLLQPLAERHSGLRPFVRQRYRRSYARLDQDFDTYFAAFSTKTRSTLRRKAKRLAERSGGRLDLRAYRGEAEIEQFYHAARALSARTYQERRLGYGLPEGEAALAEMRALARCGRLRAWLLFIDRRPSSYLYAPAEGDTLIYEYLGYDPHFAEFSPGTVLLLEALRQLMEERRFALFDFTEGEGRQKQQFATGWIDCVDLLLLKPSAANLLAGHGLTLFDAAVALAKRGVGRATA